MSDTTEPTEAECKFLSEWYSNRRTGMGLSILRAHVAAEVAKATGEELAEYLADSLWEVSALRHGLFTPPKFRDICKRVIAEKLAARAQQKDTP